MSLKSKSLTAVIWSGADVFLRRGLQFSVSIMLARLLSPAEFGTISLLYLFTGLASVLSECGISYALIQGQDFTLDDESTAFWINIGMCFTMALALWLAAPSISKFYDLPVLIPLMGILALNMFLGSLGGIHSTLLTKQLDFKTQMKIGATATTSSGLLAVGMAWRGYGVWTLAAQMLLSTVTKTCMLWFLSSWRPRFVFSPASARKLLGFGSYMVLTGLLDNAYGRIYTLIIGKRFGVSELGYYSRADSTKQLPVSDLTDVLARVAFPVFSTAAHDQQQLRRGVRQALRGIMLFNVPVMFGLITTARVLVVTLFGLQWLPAVPILKVLCLAGILWPLHVININVLLAQGHPELSLRLEIVKKVIGISLLFFGMFYGVMGIAWSQVAFSAMAFLINAYYTRRFLSYGPLRQMLDFLPVTVVSVAMALSVKLLGLYSPLSPAVLLGLQLSLGVLLFVSICFVFRVQAFMDALDIIRHRYRPFGSVTRAL